MLLRPAEGWPVSGWQADIFTRDPRAVARLASTTSLELSPGVASLRLPARRPRNVWLPGVGRAGIRQATNFFVLTP